jgi:hypothetical protein
MTQHTHPTPSHRGPRRRPDRKPPRGEASRSPAAAHARQRVPRSERVTVEIPAETMAQLVWG